MYNVSNKKSFILSMIICFIYACTDEYHQLFVKGRTGQFSDSLIDTVGALIGCSIYILIALLIKYIIKRKNKEATI